MQKISKKKLHRIIDANFNRAKEGLRVCEDICRFVLEEKKYTRQYKSVRHKLTTIVAASNADMIGSRDIVKDVGKKSTAVEFQRRTIADVYYANSQRVKESIRVLEELTKLADKRCAQALKEMRYKMYALEKEITQKL